MSVCLAEGCVAPHAAKGFCNKHYHRMRRYGTTKSRKERNARECRAEGCETLAVSLGLCNKHYHRMREHGSLDLPLTRVTKLDSPEKVQARLDQMSDRQGDCLVWQGGMVRGYGRFKANGRSILAHRASYKVNIGPIPDGMEVHHTCFNPACIEPSHLEVVTRVQNSQALKGAQGDTSSGVRGVSWSKFHGKWMAYATTQGKRYHGGYFDQLEDAEAAAVALRKELGFYGEA